MSKDKQTVGYNPANINPTQERLQRIVKQLGKYFGIFGKRFGFTLKLVSVLKINIFTYIRKMREKK